MVQIYIVQLSWTLCKGWLVADINADIRVSSMKVIAKVQTLDQTFSSLLTPSTLTPVVQTYMRSKRTILAGYKLVCSNLNCRRAEGIKIKTRVHHKACSPYLSSHRSRGAGLQYNITGCSHRRFGTHLREEHSASGSCHPRRPPQGRRQVAGGENAQCICVCRSAHLVWSPMMWNGLSGQ